MAIGSAIYYKDTCGDSMGWAKESIESAPHGALFCMQNVTGGKGRQGRSWKIYPGQVHLTFVIKPEIESLQIGEQSALLTMALTMAVYDTIKPYGVCLKWPNDFYCGSKKVGGILLESVWQSNKLIGFIVGIGINVSTVISRTDVLFESATSLYMYSKRACTPEQVQKKLLSNLNAAYNLWQKQTQESGESVFLGWQAAQSCQNKSIQVHKKNGQRVTGIMRGVSRTGDLLLETTAKQIETIQFCATEGLRLL